MRTAWNTIKDSLNRNTNRKHPPVEFCLANDRMIIDDKIVADEFNEYISKGGSV